jgi:hypothetical protein
MRNNLEVARSERRAAANYGRAGKGEGISGMSEMVERMARAYDPELWAQIDEDLQEGRHVRPARLARDKSLRQARAAIAAMRDPTEAMIMAWVRNSADSVRPTATPDNVWPDDRLAAIAAWKMFIDEALK